MGTKDVQPGWMKAYLEFLRNLTPQVLLGSVAAYLISHLELRFDPSNWLLTTYAVTTAAATVVACIANLRVFADALVAEQDSKRVAILVAILVWLAVMVGLFTVVIAILRTIAQIPH